VKRSSISTALCFILACAAATPGFAQDDDPAVLSLAEPDFTLIALPTALRVPTMKSAFRVTHRFGRSLGEGDFGDLAGDLFGLDNGAVIGLEYRFGILPNTQIGLHRSSLDKTFSFFGEYSVFRQPARPVDLAAFVSIDGTDNFKDIYTPAIGAIVSRRFAEAAAIYIEPIWVNNTNPLPAEVVDDNDTIIIGLGARVRIRPTVYLVGEVVPRVSGFDPGVHHGSFGIEKRAGGHLFQLNFSNSFATTMGQIARGGFTNDDWYMGFNISRKFF
jgi:Membrane bound beta barrel domain (DUF5777)